jgi:aminobenzoyl-glutamate utilization protein B
VLAWHPGDANRVNLGSNLAINGGKFKFYGVASHAAAGPERGRSALDGLMIMLNAVEFLREHVPQETRIHYVITNGGSAANVVPAYAEASLMARSPSAAALDSVWGRILKCAQAGALASETRFEFEQSTNYANTVPNDALADVLGRAMRKAGGYQFTPEERTFAETLQKTVDTSRKLQAPDQVQTDQSETAGTASSDVGDVSWVVPTASFTAATFVPGVGAHTWQAAACAGTSIGRKGMVVAARTLSLAAIELFQSPNEVDAAKTAFEKRRAGRTWTTHITAGSKPNFDYNK